jgi:hypothetical protein
MPLDELIAWLQLRFAKIKTIPLSERLVVIPDHVHKNRRGRGDAPVTRQKVSNSASPPGATEPDA